MATPMDLRANRGNRGNDAVVKVVVKAAAMTEDAMTEPATIVVPAVIAKPESLGNLASLANHDSVGSAWPARSTNPSANPSANPNTCKKSRASRNQRLPSWTLRPSMLLRRPK